MRFGILSGSVVLVQYPTITDFHNALEIAQSTIPEGSDFVINFTLSFEMSVMELRRVHLHDSIALALQFQETKCPPNLYLNHGSHFGEEGIPYVIEQLREKRNSNRALLSLVSQQHFIGSGNNPVPSFLILQFTMEGETLYATAYFRALELSTFLPINLEEIRIVITKLADAGLAFKTMRVAVVAFRAYIRENMNPLTKPEIDYTPSFKLLHLIREDRARLATLVRAKRHYSSVHDDCAFLKLVAIVTDSELRSSLPEQIKQPRFTNLLNELLEVGARYAQLINTASHGANVDSCWQTYTKLVLAVASEIEA